MYSESLNSNDFIPTAITSVALYTSEKVRIYIIKYLFLREHTSTKMENNYFN